MTRASKTPELLAPAGDRASLKAALLAGADAVYVGGTRFSARASAANFGRDELVWARRVTRRLGRRLYVAFNTILFDDEWGDAEAELEFLEELRPDAIIVQDLGLLKTLQDRNSRLARHLSTQGAWDGAGGAALLQDLGVERVILPRETSLLDIEHLVDRAPFELEVFVHGAHCYSVSGRCHWSVHLGPRSGNRGTCAQPCRRAYEAEGAGPTAAFSPKDLRTIGRLPELASLGIAAFKIEGRLKNARTIRRVVAAYRTVLDSTATPEQVCDQLDLAFSREWCEGFLDGPPADWRTERAVGHLGLRMGRVVEPTNASGRTVVQAERAIRTGMGLSWNEPDGLRDGRRGDKVVWASAEQGLVELRFRAQAPGRQGTVLYATASADEEDPCEGWNRAWESEGLRLRFEGRLARELACQFDAEGRTGRVCSDRCLEPARGKGIDEILRDKFQSLGEDYVVDEVDTSRVDPGLFVPPSTLKALRRSVVEALEAPRDEQVRRPCTSAPVSPFFAERSARFDYSMRVYQGDLVDELTRRLSPPRGWVVPLSCATGAAAAGPGCEGRPKLWIAPCYGPASTRSVESALAELPDADVLCFSWEAFDLAKRFPRHRFAVEGAFNVANARAAEVVRMAGVEFDTGIESPRPLPFGTQVIRVNPLVTVSRFPQAVGAPTIWRSDRGDVFHLLPLGDAVGTFLERWPQVPERFTSPMRVDVFVPPGTEVGAFVDRLQAWLGECGRACEDLHAS